MKIGNGIGRTTRWLLAAVMAFGVSTTAMAAATGVAATKHNLGSTGTGPNRTTDTAEICVFCHTPHAADVSQVGIPLWNKAFTSTAGYTTYSSSTMDAIGTGAAGVVSIGSVSIACLSCHDGTQAMDNIRNAPGSGGFDVTGGGAGGLAYTWDLGGDTMTNAVAGSLSMLGQDLSNDHPIGIQYCGGYTVALGCKDTDFVVPATGTIGGATAFWVDTSATTGRQKTDMVLYQRAFAAANGTYVAGSYPSVECASCHDPHSSANPTFLRISNAGSAVCLACHVK